ncbi:hypothetical protein M885DRAFT_521958 [Pelagophyceae sp. CCMP2097]|nr:hypothetical protein M885DRAFT_521958 [Pelagophyceae sp. CCMP2097]|mmetsp:Transcript_11854/g.40899  ORF Transcript_11854/g.40899 Transcript_11854/m.40899 type:complete len:222 (-) Transcript_11854:42-707(-)
MLDSLTEACAVNVFAFVENVWILESLSKSGRRSARELDAELYGPLLVQKFGKIEADLALDVHSDVLKKALAQHCTGKRRDEFIALQRMRRAGGLASVSDPQCVLRRALFQLLLARGCDEGDAFSQFTELVNDYATVVGDAHLMRPRDPRRYALIEEVCAWDLPETERTAKFFLAAVRVVDSVHAYRSLLGKLRRFLSQRQLDALLLEAQETFDWERSGPYH